MKRFKNILCVVEGDEDFEAEVLYRTESLARINQAGICIVMVNPVDVFDEIGGVLYNKLKMIDDAVGEKLEKQVSHLANLPLWGDLEVSGKILSGIDFIEIIRTVLHNGHDLVIKGAGAGEVDQLTMRLFRKCPCPVWIIRRDYHGPFRKILGAVDAGATRKETRLLNEKIVTLTHSLAQREQGEAHFLCAWRLKYESMLSGPRFQTDPEELSAMKQDMYSSRKRELARVVQHVRGAVDLSHLHLVEGSTDSVIISTVEELGIDVLVMGTVGRTGLPGLLIGNRAEMALRKVRCTVLAVKPDGFESPVTL